MTKRSQIANLRFGSTLRPLGARFWRRNRRCWTHSSPKLMPKFPVDAPKRRVIRTLTALGFQIVNEREHIAMVRQNSDGTRTPLTLPNHPHIKGSTLRAICTQSRIERADFLREYELS